MNFYEILEETEDGFSYNPYAGMRSEKWIEGEISVAYLNKHFGQYSTAEEMKNATESEGLKLYFAWLRDKGILN